MSGRNAHVHGHRRSAPQQRCCWRKRRRAGLHGGERLHGGDAERSNRQTARAGRASRRESTARGRSCGAASSATASATSAAQDEAQAETQARRPRCAGSRLATASAAAAQEFGKLSARFLPLKRTPTTMAPNGQVGWFAQIDPRTPVDLSVPYAQFSKIRRAIARAISKLKRHGIPILFGRQQFGVTGYCDKFATSWKIQGQYTTEIASGALLGRDRMLTSVRLRRLALQRVRLEAPRAIGLGPG